MLVYRVLESETTIALFGAGLDPGLGIFHLDQDRRSSLALDAIEAVRPYVDCWLAARLADARFTRRGFVELQGGEIRVTRPLTSHLVLRRSQMIQLIGARLKRIAGTEAVHGESCVCF